MSRYCFNEGGDYWNNPSVCLYSALWAVNWQFTVVDICEIKEADFYEEKPHCVKPGAHWLMNGLVDVETNESSLQKYISFLPCKEQKKKKNQE